VIASFELLVVLFVFFYELPVQVVLYQEELIAIADLVLPQLEMEKAFVR
jgi:hypothetical protein